MATETPAYSSMVKSLFPSPMPMASQRRNPSFVPDNGRHFLYERRGGGIRRERKTAHTVVFVADFRRNMSLVMIEVVRLSRDDEFADVVFIEVFRVQFFKSMRNIEPSKRRIRLGSS